MHEVKFDGYRVQMHRHARQTAILTKNGYDYTPRLRALAQGLTSLPAHSVVIDGELVAYDLRGTPNFYALHAKKRNPAELAVWAFDLLHLDGRDLREAPLEERKLLLHKLVLKTHVHWLRFSEPFREGAALFLAAERMGLEGVVSKRKGSRYSSGRSKDWVKVKCALWRAANIERWRLFGNKS